MARIGNLTSQIVTGQCPECRTETLLVSFEPHIYRCVNCGYDLEQKMAKKLPKFGVNNYHKRTPKKRPGRHAKKYSKRTPYRKAYRGQGR